MISEKEILLHDRAKKIADERPCKNCRHYSVEGLLVCGYTKCNFNHDGYAPLISKVVVNPDESDLND